MANYDGSLVFDTKIDKRGMEKGIASLKSSITKFAKISAVALSAVGLASIKAGSDFEAGMGRVGALSGATAKELDELTSTAKQLGKDTVFSATQASEAMSYLAMAGFKTNEIIETMPGLLSLAAAGQTDLGVAADITSNILSGFGMEASQSAHMADVLALAFTSSNTSLESLGETMKYAAPVAKAAGFSLEETAAAAGLLGDAGIQGSMAGTALRGVMLRLVNPPKQAADALDLLGVQLLDSRGEMKSLADIVQELETKTKGMTEAQKTAIISQIAGQNAASGLLAIMDRGSDTLREFTGELENAGGTADKIAEKQLDNLKGDFELLKSVLEGLGIAIYENMTNPLRTLTQGLTSHLDILLSTIETMKQYVEATGDVEGGIKRIVNVVTNMLLKAMTGIIEKLPELIDSGAMVVSNIITGITSMSPHLIEVASNIFNSIIQAIGTILPMLIEAGASIIDNIATGFTENSTTIIENVIDLVILIADSIINNIETIAKAGLEIILALAKGLIDNLPKLIEEVPRIINEFSTKIYDLLPKVIKTGWEIIKALAKGLVESIPILVSNIPAIIKAMINVFTMTNWAKIGKDIITWIGNGITNMGPKIVNITANLGEWIVNTIVNIFKKGPTIGKNFINLIKTGIMNMLSTIVSSAKSLAISVTETIYLVFLEGVNIGKDLVKGIWNGISSMAGWIVEKVSGFASNIVNTVKDKFKIKSPSQVMRDEVGVMIVKGIGEGIQKETPGLRNLTAQEMDKVISDYGKYGEDAVKQYSKLSSKEMAKLKKQYKKDGEGLSEAIAEGQKSKLNAITGALDKIRDETTKHLDKLGEATITALRRQYEEEERVQTRSIENKIKLAEKESNERIAIYEKELAYKLNLLDVETNEELRMLQSQIDSINAQTDAEEKAIKEREFQDKLAKKEESLRLAKTKKDKDDIQAEIDEMLAQRQREHLLEQRKEQIQDLKDEMDRVRQQAQDKKASLELEYNTKIEHERKLLENTINYYNSELTATRKHYETLLKEENLQAEARRLILDENNKDLIALLESYNPDWHDAGQSFGQSLLDGLNSMKHEIADVVDEIMSMVSTAEMANSRIIQSKLDYEVARQTGDAKGMEYANKRAERYRQQGGDIGADVALNLNKYQSQLNEKLAAEQARNNRYQETTDYLRSNQYARGVTQNITIVSPENTPAENARLMKQRGEELARGY